MSSEGWRGVLDRIIHPGTRWETPRFGRGIGRQAEWRHGERGMQKMRTGEAEPRRDEAIYEDVREVLSVHPALDATGIEVKVLDGEVTLTGFVLDPYGKQLAEDAAAKVRGVRDVDNLLRVRLQ